MNPLKKVQLLSFSISQILVPPISYSTSSELIGNVIGLPFLIMSICFQIYQLKRKAYQIEQQVSFILPYLMCFLISYFFYQECSVAEIPYSLIVVV
jgi:hypothetical protein